MELLTFNFFAANEYVHGVFCDVGVAGFNETGGATGNGLVAHRSRAR
jgi:hypothetical protein